MRIGFFGGTKCGYDVEALRGVPEKAKPGDNRKDFGGTPKAKPGDERTDFGVPVSQVRLVR